MGMRTGKRLHGCSVRGIGTRTPMKWGRPRAAARWPFLALYSAVLLAASGWVVGAFASCRCGTGIRSHGVLWYVEACLDAGNAWVLVERSPSWTRYPYLQGGEVIVHRFRANWALPAVSRRGSSSIVLVPLWLPLALFLLVTVAARRVSRRRPLLPECETCGYNLTGNVSGQCPECGTPIPGTTGAAVKEGTQQ
jgi:hypothetical protein